MRAALEVNGGVDSEVGWLWFAMSLEGFEGFKTLLPAFLDLPGMTDFIRFDDAVPL